MSEGSTNTEQQPQLATPEPIVHTAEFQSQDEIIQRSEAIKREIEELMESEQLGSPKSMAFCDFVDLKLAKQPIAWSMSKMSEDIERIEGNPSSFDKDIDRNKSEASDAQIAAIKETIRTRKNEIPGYKREADNFWSLDFRLVSLYQGRKDMGKGIDVRMLQENSALSDIKEKHIAKFNQPVSGLSTPQV